MTMSAISNEIVDRYIALWNEGDGARRRALIDAAWAPTARYIDPMADCSGPAEVDALIGAVQGKYAGLRFSRTGTVDEHHDQLRFSWVLGPEGGAPLAGGTDIATIVGGKFERVVGFLDFVPPQA